MKISRRCYIGLGSNIPLRRHYLKQARGLLAAEGRLVAVSSIYESPPWRDIGTHPYLNQVVALDTVHAPADLMERLLHIEQRLGRRRDAGADRTIDLDLLDYAGQIIHTPHLQLPHPRMHRRAFVLLPLQEIAPRWRHPVSHQTIDQLLAAIPQAERVQTRRVGNVE